MQEKKKKKKKEKQARIAYAEKSDSELPEGES